MGTAPPGLERTTRRRVPRDRHVRHPEAAHAFWHSPEQRVESHPGHIWNGFRTLAEKNQMWVLSKFQMEIHKPSRWGEHISIETWSKGIDRFYALRDFIIWSEQGEKAASATTAWMVLDKGSYRRRSWST